MSRLTEKEIIIASETGFYKIKDGRSNTYITDLLGNKREINNLFLASQKLGELEDIEEELEIDLVYIFNVLKNGIWVKQPSYIAMPIYKIDSIDLKLCINSYGNVSFKKMYHEDLDGCLEETGEEYELSKYGKQDYGVSWALTKEELL